MTLEPENNNKLYQLSIQTGHEVILEQQGTDNNDCVPAILYTHSPQASSICCVMQSHGIGRDQGDKLLILLIITLFTEKCIISQLVIGPFLIVLFLLRNKCKVCKARTRKHSLGRPETPRHTRDRASSTYTCHPTLSVAYQAGHHARSRDKFFVFI